MTTCDDLLVELRIRGWELRFYGLGPSDITAVVAIHRWPRYADILVLRGEDHAVAYRAPIEEDVLAPSWVTWWYAASATWTMRAVLTIDPPATNEPPPLVPAPVSCGVPPTERNRVRLS